MGSVSYEDALKKRRAEAEVFFEKEKRAEFQLMSSGPHRALFSQFRSHIETSASSHTRLLCSAYAYTPLFVNHHLDLVDSMLPN